MSILKTAHEMEIDQIHDRQLAEKDAEIERLKALITELCDALVNDNHIWFNEGDDLIQRAREATR
jgi:hypothetical protein